MMTDDEIVAWADQHSIGGEYSCSATEMRALLELAKQVPDGGSVCEIGVLYGRSASVYLLEQGRRTRGHRASIAVHLVDCWVLNEADAQPTYELMLSLLPDGWCFVHEHWLPSQLAAVAIPNLDLLHIDGDHDQGVWDDCRLYLPKINLGGVVAIHDYAAPGEPTDYPEVRKAVGHYFLGERVAERVESNLVLCSWQVLPRVGRLFSARRIA